MIPIYFEYQIVAAGLNQAINIGQYIEEYRLYTSGPITLVGDVTITATGKPEAGDVVVVRYEGGITLNGHTITILGSVLSQAEAMSKLRIELRYDGASWVAVMFQDVSRDATNYMAVKRSVWNGAGGTISLVPGIDEYYQVFYTSGPVAAAGSYVVQVDPGITPVEGDMFIVKYEGIITLGAQSITIFGITVPALQALGGNLEFRTIYDADTATWTSSCKVLLDNDIYRVMGSSFDTSPAYLDSKVAKSVIVASDKIELDGDATAPGAGYYYGTDAAGAKGFYPIASGTITNSSTVIQHSDILQLNSVPVMLIANPGIGKAIDVIHCVYSIYGAAGIVTPYATFSTLHIKTDTADVPFESEDSILTSTINRTNCTSSLVSLGMSTTNRKIISNKALYLSTTGGDPTGGAVGQYLTIDVMYRIVDI
jgi:hypothetical protein